MKKGVIIRVIIEKKEFLKTFCIVLGIGETITFAWKLLELVIDGQIVARRVDSIIAMILTFSLYSNINSYLHSKKKRS